MLASSAFGLTAALAYAPVDHVASAPEDIQLHANIGPIRPTTGVKGGLPDRLKPATGAPDWNSEDEVEQDPHSADRDANFMPSPSRAAVSDIKWGDSDLPPPVLAMRDSLIKAARTGEIDALRPIFAGQTLPPIVSTYVDVEDEVDFLRHESGDAEGREILAILLEILETGHVRLEEDGTYVWPYFAEVPLEELQPEHYVELYRILTSIDVEEMQRMGRYTFFRVGISDDGRLRYFTAGDIE
ncbi:hypothetical protein [Acuticoccus yangtzensis]|uniref:hypothetical protein n=1 Tax=Acuticoccus yangtzensis TaxID=1443441 RepID=UPI0009497546|nr:hypothetical protein [Acuticoccus yangtzensis]